MSVDPRVFHLKIGVKRICRASMQTLRIGKNFAGTMRALVACVMGRADQGQELARNDQRAHHVGGLGYRGCDLMSEKSRVLYNERSMRSEPTVFVYLFVARATQAKRIRSYHLG